MGLKWRWTWQEAKPIGLAFRFVSEDWLLCFLLIGQLKVRFHFSEPLQKVISGAKLFGPALPAARNSLCTPGEVGPGETVGNISSHFIERSINRSLLLLTL